MEATLAQCTKAIDFKETVKEIRKDLSDVQTDLAARLDTQSVKHAKQEDLDKLGNTIGDMQASIRGARLGQEGIRKDLEARISNETLRDMRDDFNNTQQSLNDLKSRQTRLETEFDEVLKFNYHDFRRVPGALADLEGEVKDLQRWTTDEEARTQRFVQAYDNGNFVTRDEITKASRTLRSHINDEIQRHGVVTTAELDEVLANLNKDG